MMPQEKAWQQLLQRGLNPGSSGDLTQCPECRQWSNVPCECHGK